MCAVDMKVYLVFIHSGRLTRNSDIRNILTITLGFLSLDLLSKSPQQISRLEDHPLLAMYNYLFNAHTTAIYIWRCSPPFQTFKQVML